MSLMYCLDQISVSTIQFTEVVSSVFATKEIGSMRYGLVITFVCFLSNFQMFPYVFNLNCACINNGLTKVTLLISDRISLVEF